MLAPVAEAEFGEAGRRLLELGLRSAALWPAFAAELRAAAGVDVGLRAYGHAAARARRRRGARARAPARASATRSACASSGCAPSAGARARAGARADAARWRSRRPTTTAVDPRRVLARAARAPASAAGVRLREHAAVRAARARRGGRRVDGRASLRRRRARASARSRSCSRPGAWSGAARGLSARARGVPVRPVKGQILRLRDPAGPGLLDGVLRFEGGYLVPRGDGRYVLGATVEERGFDARAATAGGVYELLRDAHELVPGRRASWRSRSCAPACARARPTTLPAIGPGALDGPVWATGHHRNGILLAPLTARAASRRCSTAASSARRASCSRRCDPARFAPARRSPREPCGARRRCARDRAQRRARGAARGRDASRRRSRGSASTPDARGVAVAVDGEVVPRAVGVARARRRRARRGPDGDAGRMIAGWREPIDSPRAPSADRRPRPRTR